MQEENNTPLSPESEPQTDAEPVDTAAAMKYFEAAEAAAEVGKEILASRKPKKPQKQKKTQKQPKRGASDRNEPTGGESEKSSPAKEPDHGWQPSQQEQAASDRVKAEDMSAGQSGRQKKTKKLKKAAKASSAKTPMKKPPTPAEAYKSMERSCTYVGMQVLREYHTLRRLISQTLGNAKERLPALWREQRQLQTPEQASPVLPGPSRERDGVELPARLRQL